MTRPNVAIKSLDPQSVHRISSGQVVVDLQTAVKELVENSLDAGATNIEVRFKEYGLKSIQVIDNGCGISAEDYPNIALKHYTSKLSTLGDLSTLLSFGFRGEALSSLCALSEDVSVITSTANLGGLGDRIEVDSAGKVTSIAKIARQRGTTVIINNLFKPLPVRRKELERNSKREFGKALSLLNAYALVPCLACSERKGVRLTVLNQTDDGRKTTHISAPPSSTLRECVSSLWGPKALDHIVDLDVSFSFSLESRARPTMENGDESGSIDAKVTGVISKFDPGCGRTGTDRQFFYVNGRPWNGSKIQKVFNEVYRSFNANQSPFVIADLQLPTNVCDVNVSPDKRTIFLHGEGNLLGALKIALEDKFASSRSTYDLEPLNSQDNNRIASQSKRQTVKKRMNPASDGQATNGESQDTTTTDASPQPSQSSQSPNSVPPLDANSPCESFDQDITEQSQSFISSFSYSGTPISDPSSGKNTSPSLSPGKSRPANSKSSPPTFVQTVLDTTGAIWNRQSNSNEPPRKKRRPEAVRDDPNGLDVTEQDEGMGEATESSIPNDGHADLLQDNEVPERESVTSTATHRRVSIVHEEVDMESDNEDQLQESFQKRPQKQDNRPHTTRTKRRLPSERECEPEPMEIDELMDGTATCPPDLSRERVRSDRISVRQDEPNTRLTELIDLTGPQNETEESQVTDSEVTISTYEEFVTRKEIVKSLNGIDKTLRFDLSRVSSVWRRLTEIPELCGAANSAESIARDGDKDVSPAPVPLAFCADQDDKAAEATLSRVIDKTDFGKMDIVGQFNRGFIVTRRRQGPVVDTRKDTGGKVMDDLFIIDQHAADEKYNFETLQQTTKINSQRLLRPQPLELTAADELLATDNLEILKQNGFEVEVIESEAAQRHRLQLVAQPVSKGTMFDMKDLEELIQLLRDRPSGHMVRCSKARAMFAMRACRKSVMVGMPLSKPQMISVVRHMGTMDQPWNCPHGRPTMRHLSDITAIRDGEGAGRSVLDWRSLGKHL